MNKRYIVLFLITNILTMHNLFAEKLITVKGTVNSTSGEPLEYVTVAVEKTNSATYSGREGEFSLKVPVGKQSLILSLLGYEPKTIDLSVSEKESPQTLNVVLTKSDYELDEVEVKGKSPVQKINESAYNALAIDAKKMHNTPSELTDALSKAPGMKVRESGGVGSDTRLMMDGFSGKHIKVFIDGIPQEGVGGSFSLNNIPVNFAERIEVYRGVVPVAFGTDALAGIVNIVTNKSKEKWFVDASYSYGSFNTHKTYVNFGQTFKNGLTYEINAFQNYSDNDYHIDDAIIHEFLGPDEKDGVKSSDDNRQRVKRFHDTYHNESVIGKIGVVNKTWADRLMFGFNYSRFYKEIQNGVEQDLVFGDKHRKGYSIMPSMEYRKLDLFAKGFDVTLTANYNKNISNNIDTATYRYNWLGEKQKMSSPGETTYADTRSDNNNWNVTFTANYRLGEAHTFTFNHVLNNFRRKNTGTSGASGASMSNAIEKETRKNVSGLSYQLMPTESWNVSVFGKYYNQHASGPVATDANGTNYKRSSNSVSSTGYGAAGTYFFRKMIQAKLSYERAYRLPTNEEMFGDEDMEHGDFAIRPENSDNYNFSLSFAKQYGDHSIYVEGGLIYRNAKDYIQRIVNTSQGNARKSYASYENHGRVESKGYNIALHYAYSNWLSLSGNLSQIDTRDNVKTTEEGSSQVNVKHGDRMPNVPYLFANSDLTLYWRDLGKKGNMLTVSYDNYFQNSFPRHSESLGGREKKMVPTQFSHNMSIAYSLMNGRYNFSLECRNLTDEKLYDNFGLQKAGRAFYGKFRIYFGSK